MPHARLERGRVLAQLRGLLACDRLAADRARDTGPARSWSETRGSRAVLLEPGVEVRERREAVQRRPRSRPRSRHRDLPVIRVTKLVLAGSAGSHAAARRAVPAPAPCGRLGELPSAPLAGHAARLARISTISHVHAAIGPSGVAGQPSSWWTSVSHASPRRSGNAATARRYASTGRPPVATSSR